MSEVPKRHVVNGKISRLVHEHWKSDHHMSTILAQGDLIAALQELSDETMTKALEAAYDEGRHDAIKDMEK